MYIFTLPTHFMADLITQQARDCYYTKKMNQASHYNFSVIQILGNVGQVTKKSFVEPIWRAGGTQAENSAKFGQNGLCMLAGISKTAPQNIFL